MNRSPSIAVTGMAWTTPLGDDLDGVWRQLEAGEHGFVPIPIEGRIKNTLGAVVSSPPLDVPAGDRMLAIGEPALRRALAAAGLGAADPGVAIVLGTSLAAFLEGEPSSAPLHAWADALARAVGATAPPVSLSTACSSSADAILVAAELIRAGAARACVCGGVDVLTNSKRLAHSILGTLSPTLLRAFDLRHDGTLLGEGAAFLVLESEESLGDRTPLAWLRGVGSANDAAGMTMPDAAGLGARLAMERSLDDAGLGPEAIGVVNAHGSGTPLNDATEAIAFRAIFGGKGKPIIFGTKGNFGHSLGATGAMEAIALLLALKHGRVPPVASLEQPDPALEFPLPQGAPMPLASRVGLSVTLGFGGFDTSLVFEVGRDEVRS